MYTTEIRSVIFYLFKKDGTSRKLTAVTVKGEQGLKGDKGESATPSANNQRVLADIENKMVQSTNNILFFDNKIEALSKTVQAQRDQILFQEKVIKQLIKRLTDLGLNIY